MVTSACLPGNAQATPPAPFLTSEQAAPLLGVPESTVQLWCRTGRLPAVRLGKHWLIPARAIAELADKAYADRERRAWGGGE